MIAHRPLRTLRRSRFALAAAALIAAYVTVAELPHVSLAAHAAATHFS